MGMQIVASELIKKARKYEKEAKLNPPSQTTIRIAVLGSFSIQYYVKTLRYNLHQCGIEADFYEGEYNGITMDVFDDESNFYKFCPNVVVVLPYYADVKTFPTLFDSDEVISEKVKSQLEYYHKVWDKIHEKLSCHILQSNIVIPNERQLGNLEDKYSFSRRRFLKKINEGLFNTAKEYVTILDLESLADGVGKNNWFDKPSYYLTKTGFRLDYLPEVIDLSTSLILALSGKTKKCLVLDLDNTLWGGVVGDEGWEGIQIDPNNAVGEAYRAFQSYILLLKERGVILAVCSKNDEAIAKEPFEKNDNMILKLSDIACFVANWEDKAGNIRRIAAELNIGTDSLVFFDDNPAEREIVRTYLPEVEVIETPTDPAEYVTALDEAFPFEWLQITKEDVSRSSSYTENKKREELLTSFVDYDEYLKALQMKGKVALLETNDVARFSQLINKSNQFNLRTQRYSEGEITEFMHDNNCRCLYAKLKDMFSEYGIISCVILRIKGNECFIDTWVMSCRVLKRGVEYLMFKRVLDIAKEVGCDCIKAEYLKTKKNAMVSKFYDELGFTLTSMNGNSSEYILTELKYEKEIFITEE